MTRSEFIFENPLGVVLGELGIDLTGVGDNRMAQCPFHKDSTASMSVKLSDGTWFCHACQIGGGVIDFLAKREGISPIEFIKRNGINGEHHQPVPKQKPNIEKTYSYQNGIGQEVYQVVRLVPKSFRQRRPDGKGGWVYNMEGVERVLYRLPEVMKSETVWIVEGEKDADNLTLLGYTATCNVGGAGKWLDGYTESLAGKDVVLCGDNDDPGRKHIESVFEALAGKVKSAKLIKVPAPAKDVSDFIAAKGKTAKEELDKICAEATPFYKGIHLPLFSMAEIEPRYQKQAKTLDQSTLDLGAWLPSLRPHVRRLVPGEVVLLIGDTGTGKTAMLQSIALHSRPIPTIMFEMEVPEELIYERFIAMKMRQSCKDIENNYRNGQDSAGPAVLDNMFGNLLICTEPNLGIDKLESYITRAELKLGQKPLLVLIDYVQLMNGLGKRYERVSDAAEGIKTLAKSTRTIIVIASQVHRSEEQEIGLHSAKDSGSLENSAGLVLGIWRNPAKNLVLKVLKNTKGTGGFQMECIFDGEKMIIEEKAMIQDEDVPRSAYND